MRRDFTLTVGFAIAATLLLITPAAAQTKANTKPARVVLSVNGIYQTGTSDVTSTVSFPANAETATFTSTFPVAAGTGFDAGARVTLRGAFGVGVAGTKFSAAGDADVTAKIPHPFFFSQPRSIAGTAALTRDETTVRIELVFHSAPGKKLQFTGYVGPTYFSVKQDLVDAVTYTDAYPYDTATFGHAATKQASTSKWGFAGGADVSYYFTKSIGVGAMVTIAKASMSVKASDGSPVDLTAGGTQAGGGLRLRF